MDGEIYVDFVLTDPVLMSKHKNKHGPSDLGNRGMQNFFYWHKCGKYCDSNWRKHPNPEPVYR